MVLTANPPDWSPFNVNNAASVEEFLRLINSDLYLFDLDSRRLKRLTDAPGYDYSAVFSPDGKRILFISSRSGRGAFYVMDCDDSNVEQITNRKPGSYDVPVGRSDTFRWSAASNVIVYEAQGADQTDTVRSIRPDGSEPKELGQGKAPQLVNAGAAVIFLSPHNEPRVIELK